MLPEWDVRPNEPSEEEPKLSLSLSITPPLPKERNTYNPGFPRKT